MGVVGKGILESTFTILYIQIEPYRMVLFFLAENNEQIYKMVCSFLKNANP